MDDALRQERVYYARRELGLCVKCGMDIEEPGKYKLCAKCREVYRKHAADPDKREMRRQYQKEYKEKIDIMCKNIARMAHMLMATGDLKTPDRSVPENHKCWKCFWATWCGDRFFCPLYGSCIKSPTKREVSTND